MRKSTYLLAMSLCVSLTSLHAQHILDYIDAEYPGADSTFFFEEAFAELDTSSYINTGFLWDRTSPNVPLHLYNGTSSSEVSVDAKGLMQGYLDIRGAAIQPANLPDYDSLVNLTEQLITGYDAIPIMVIDLSLNRIKSNAFDQGKLSFTNGVLHADGEGSPFEEIDVFMAGMLNQTFPVNDTFNIVAPYLLYCGTNNQTVSGIRIDLNDGNGWQGLSWNQPKAFYLSGEEGEFDFRIEITYSDESVKISKNKGHKKSTGCIVIPPEEAPWGGEIVTFQVPYKSGFATLFGGFVQYDTYTRYVRYHLTSSELYGGLPGRGKVYVRYREGASATPPKRFKKPVIVVEGIDFGEAIPLVMELWPQFSNSRIDQAAWNFSNTTRLGTFGWPEMFGCNSSAYPNAKMPDFVDSLYNNDNDLILLDFKDGADHIQRNAMLLKELINRVNQNKVGDEEIVIVGVSMGGQVTRYALTHMEANGEDHCVRLFASHDSPWRGAHIAASLQFFAKYFSELHNVAQAKEIIHMLNRPAARQLLLYHYTNEGTNQNNVTVNKVRYYHWGYNGSGVHPLRQVFVNELAALGDYPKKCRNVAVANGNSEGNQKFGPGATLYSLNSSCFGYDLRFNFYNIGRSDALVGDFNRNGSYRRKWLIYGMPNLAGVPGGYRDDLKELKQGIEKELPWYCNGVSVPNAQQERFTFVPTISSLDIGNTSWNAKASLYAKENDASSLGNTHFEMYHSPEDDNDEDHGQVTDGNIIWLMKQIRLGEKKLETDNNSILTKTWNNPTENGFIGTLAVNTGGVLYLNAARPIYDYTDPYDPHPIEGSLSHVRIGGVCSSTKTITVNSGGKIIIGDNNQMNNRAYLYIGDGAMLTINSGGEVLVKENSKLIVESGGRLIINSGTLTINDAQIIVEDGGELVYKDGATISLAQYGSVLKMNGKLSIGDNANFTVSGFGKLIFDQDVKWSASGFLQLSEYWDIGQNATFDMQGPASPYNEGHNLIEAYRPVYFHDGTNSFTQVTLRNGRIALHQGALIYSYSATDLYRIKVEAAYSWQTHAGFRIWANSTTSSIFQCKFLDGNPGLLLHNLAGSAPMSVRVSEFKNCKRGLKIVDGPFSVYGCDFLNNDWGIIGEDLTGQSVVNNCSFSAYSPSGKIGIDAIGATGASLQIANSDFSHLNQGFIASGMNVRSTCSDYSFIVNTSQSGDEAAINLVFSILDISENAENRFWSNTLDIYLHGMAAQTGIRMKDGFNDFEPRGSSGGLYISGHIYDDAPLFSDPLIADDNRIQTYRALNGVDVMPVTVHYGPSYTKLTVDADPNLTSIQRTCDGSIGIGVGVSGSYAAIESYAGGGGTISTGNYPSSTLKAAALDAVEDITIDEDEIRDDRAAVVKISEILSADISNPDSYTERIKTILYMQMHVALNNSFGYGAMINSENLELEINDTLQDVIDILDGYLSDYNPNDSLTYGNKFRYTLDKSHILRIGGYYDEALGLLGNSEAWTFNTTQAKRAGYWNCACEAERAYFEEELAVEDYINQKEECKQQFAGYTHKTARVSDPGNGYIVEDQQISIEHLYPQPTESTLTLEIYPGCQGTVPYEITDLAGRIIYTSSEVWNGSEMTFDVEHLITGAYFMRLHFGKDVQVVRFVKK